MKIGMNMLLWTDHVTEDHFKIIDDLKLTGYDGIEISLGRGDVKHYTMLGDHLKALGMGLTAVTALDADRNIASSQKSIRAAGLGRIKWAIERAHAAGADLIGGPFHSAFAHITRRPPTDDERKWSAENLHQAAEYAEQADIFLVPEALNRFECYLCNTMTDLRKLVEAVDHPNLMAMYDSHHAHIEEKSQAAAITTINPYLRHVHISENDRGTPGRGQVHWGEVFTSLNALDYEHWLTIEAFSTVVPDFANAINVWRDFSPADEIYREGLDFIKQQWNEA
ncbi:MAG: sugar phosphate isomerase/epimerase family protein [Bacteroidota bacterium]